jgi:uncharacterized protein YndB with AHSA1/START domain
MRSPDGLELCKRGAYREIVPPERLVFTYAWEDATGALGHETIVTVRFEAIGEQTRLTLHQAEFESAERCEAHRDGWTGCLERFAAWLATHQM